MIDEIELAMILYTQGHKIKHDVAHFIKVHQYARLIGKAEHLEEREQFILEVAAICHDRACPLCREKYGRCEGDLQEKEGPALVKEFLKDFNLDRGIIERAAYLVGHHHTYTNINGMDYQILVEADFLVNYFENGSSADTIQKSVEKIFKTKTGKEMAETMFFPKPADLSLSETWAQDALQDLEDFIEEQGIYIRQ